MKSILLALLAAGAFVAPGAQAALKYKVEAVEFDGPALLSAVALNNRGQVAGYLEDGVVSRPFIYGQGRFEFIPQAGKMGYPVALNDRGQVLLNGNTVPGNFTQPFIYSGTGPALNISPGTGAYGYGKGLNNLGHAVGLFDDRVFFHDGMQSRTLDIRLDGARAVFASGLNDLDTVIGRAPGERDSTRAFIYREGQASFVDGLSDAFDINNAAQILGETVQGHVIRHGDGSLTLLPFTAAPHLNEKGWVAGHTLVDGVAHAVVYRDGRTQDLNGLLAAGATGRWTLGSALDINDRGQVLGTGLLDGHRSAFVATPVPEPQAWALMLGGLAVIGAAVRRRRRGG